MAPVTPESERLVLRRPARSVAATEKVAEPPATTVRAAGCDEITGAVGPVTMVSWASELFTNPKPFETWTSKFPASAAETLLTVRLAPLAPRIGTPFLRHW